MVNVVLSGHGTKANDLYAPYDPAFDNSLVRNQDIAQAKWLLKQAGHEKLTVSLISDSEVGGEVEMCEVLAADAAKAGITINYRQLDTATYDRMEYKWPFATDWWPGFHFLTMTALSLLPGASINETHFNDHEFNTLYAEAASELNETKRTELIHEMQKIFFDRGSFLIPIYLNTLGGYSDKVAGFTHDLTGDGLGQAGFDRVYFV
jgi:peptide/nickel transport system substrate-binding protein